MRSQELFLQSYAHPARVCVVRPACDCDECLPRDRIWHVWHAQVEWREYSFFQNPRMSRAVNESRLRVEVCGAGAAGCADGSGPGATTVRCGGFLT